VRDILAFVFVSAWVAGCGANTPFEVMAPQATDAEASCTTDPTDHVLQIDKRGNYQPITFHRRHCENSGDLQQPRPSNWRQENCQGIVPNGDGLSQDEVNRYTALECHIHRIIQDLTSEPTHPKHLVIFVHGGLVTPKEALVRALEDIPRMIDQKIDPAFMSGSQIFPLFYIWPSGFFDSYVDAMVNYSQGEFDSSLRRAGTPLYVGTDLAKTASQAPLELAKSLRRFSDAYLGTSDEPAQWGCDLNAAHFGCDQLGPLQPNFLDMSVYAATTPLRVVTAPSLDTGTSAWKNMVARTRFAFTKYSDPASYRAVFDTHRGPGEGPVEAKMTTSEDILTRGALYFFFKELSKVIPKHEACAPNALRITVIGHSMGEMVLNELMQNFPDLPYQNIVYMAAAGSIRDFKAMTEPVLRNPRCKDLKFYNLSLHTEAEERDLEEVGFAPIGSLLMWIDDIFETPVTPLDRTLGKWQNIVYAENEFDRTALSRSYFHRFGLEAPDPLMHGQFAGPLTEREKPGEVCKAYNYWDPDFWSQVCTAKGTDCNCTRLLVSPPVPGTSSGTAASGIPFRGTPRVAP
jgi:hypothetical protein